MATIHDVAKKAGVSVATVSRVINDSHKVSGPVREKVQEAVADLHYTPNLIGKNLRRKYTKTILVLVPFISEVYFGEIVRGVEDYSRQAGYKIILCNTENSVEREREYLDYAKNKLADGAVWIDARMPTKEANMYASFVPLVQCNEYRREFKVPAIAIDEEGAAFDMVSYLIKKGHRRIAFLDSSIPYMASINRAKGYARALESAGLPYDTSLQIKCDYTFEGARDKTKELLTRDITPDALFCTSDIMAAAARFVFYENGIRIPDDISLASIDDEPISYMAYPAITTVHPPRYEMGTVAMEALLSCIQGTYSEEKQVHFLPHYLVERQSIKSKI